jgi:integrase
VLRIGEAKALQPGDLDFISRFIEIKRSFSKSRLTTPKNGKTRRVDMSKDLAVVLKKYLTERKKEALRKGWSEPPEWLFYNENGKRIDIENLRKRIFYKCLEKAELRQIRLHDIRHTYATLRIMKGDNIVDVSNQLGHSDVSITLKTYTHGLPGSKKSEVDKFHSDTEPTCALSAPSAGQEKKKDLEN